MLWAPQRVTLCTVICTVSGCLFTALTGYRMFPCHTHVSICVFIFCCIPNGVVRRCAFCLWPVGYALVQTPWRRGSFALTSQGDAASFPSAISEKFTKPECHTLCHTYLKSISWILCRFSETTRHSFHNGLFKVYCLDLNGRSVFSELGGRIYQQYA